MATSSPPLNKGKSKAIHHLASGALSGFSSAIVLQPLDLLKTRLQQGGSGAKRLVLAFPSCPL
jgi:solute carrier family 25 protein 38